jgi:hypothetical protein
MSHALYIDHFWPFCSRFPLFCGIVSWDFYYRCPSATGLTDSWLLLLHARAYEHWIFSAIPTITVTVPEFSITSYLTATFPGRASRNSASLPSGHQCFAFPDLVIRPALTRYPRPLWTESPAIQGVGA